MLSQSEQYRKCLMAIVPGDTVVFGPNNTTLHVTETRFFGLGGRPSSVNLCNGEGFPYGFSFRDYNGVCRITQILKRQTQQINA